MGPGKQEWTGAQDMFRARLDQIINLKHELVRLAGEIDWAWIDAELAGCFSEEGRPGLTTRFMVGLLLLKHIHGLSDEEVCARWVYDPYFQYFTGEEFFAHDFPHERSGMSHWRKRIGGKPLGERLLRELQRQAARRAAQRGNLLQPQGSEGCNRAVASPLQHRQTALLARLSATGTANFCAADVPSSGENQTDESARNGGMQRIASDLTGLFRLIPSTRWDIGFAVVSITLVQIIRQASQL